MTPTQVDRSPVLPSLVGPRVIQRRPPVLELMALAALAGLIAGFGAGAWLESINEPAVESALAAVR
jgi:hypothetical protein